MSSTNRSRWRPLAIVVTTLLALPGVAAAQERRLDVNDVTFLWPPPAAAADVDRLVGANELLDGGASPVWPEAAFKVLLDTAGSTTVTSSAGTLVNIDFAQFAEAFRQPQTWKVVAFRIDPSAPGSHPSLVAQFGSTPQIRLILQPVTVKNGVVTVHDVTAHLAYSFITAIDPQTRIPSANTKVFTEIVNDAVALKAMAEKAGAATAGALTVHPALTRQVADVEGALRALLKKRLAQGQLTEMAFMGIDPPEPWIFFAMARRADGSFVTVGAPSLGGQPAQMLTLRGGTPVMPSPQTTNVDLKAGVSTAGLFARDADGLGPTPAIPGTTRPLHADIPDIVANPRLSTVRNTDCVSCHTESTRRTILKLTAADPSLTFARPAHVSGLDPAVSPQSVWNVRNLGWFQSRDGVIHPTITMRTANEVAEAVEFINTEYLAAPGGPTPPPDQRTERIEMPNEQPVASPLTLVMDIKSPQDFTALKALIEKLQALPPEQNPIWRALTKLATVHFARFVFLSEKQLAVITTYDGSFDDYIDAFVNSIGDVFDQLLAHMADAPPLPVSEHRQEFLAYVRKHDLQAIAPFYSAYPQLKVLDILTLEKERRK